ncbi:fatty acid CoA ligase family protein [Neorhodopirellula lusitana]|uniref:fatty acid CoA ligase family protein n=1 Tax=Neorhodopirellula lusitana TaxID=445327 RepID=UPI003850940A
MTATDPNHSCSDSVLASPSSGNVADRLTSMAKMLPGAIAIAEVAGPPKLDGTDRDYALTTFKALDEGSTKIARGLTAWGVRPGMRLVSLVPFGGQFIQLVFALMKSGVTVVLIDPGMDRKHLVNCISEIRPDGFVGIPKAQAIRTLLRHRFPQAKWNVTVGKRWFWGGKTLSQIIELGEAATCELPEVSTDHEAAVIFTTGSTGPPKGVSYTHETFHSQIDRIQARYDIRRGSRDLACFPLFGLFDAVMGVTTIIPEMDPTRPAAVDPRKLIQAARQWEVDQAFGSPALWRTVTKWCEANAVGRPFPTLRRVLSAGAPVPVATLASLRRFVHEEAMIDTPYGATEALPIASIESRQVIAETGPASMKGKGVCVGSRFPDVQWKVIEVTDGPITQIADVVELNQGKIGELMVSGPMVTRRYVTRLDQNDIHKVADGDRVWHRMGDVGYFDAEDRFWFCGRKTHRVTGPDRTYFTVPCEAIFNVHPRVEKCALVGRGEPGKQVPVVVIEPSDLGIAQDAAQRDRLIEELRDLATRNPLTRRISEFVVRDQPLPVDIRHNSKIFREKLTAEVQS